MRRLGLIGLIAVPLWAQSTGISTPFADVEVRDVPLGKVFVVKHSSGDGLSLQNLGAEAVPLRIQVIPPSTTDLRGGAEVIPDVSWVQVTPDRLVLPPQGRALCRVTLQVPREKAYQRKYYQAMIWSHTEPQDKKTVSMSAGLISRLRFRTQ